MSRRDTSKVGLPTLLALLLLTLEVGGTIPAAPNGRLETGVPPFTVLGRESLGLRALPSDLHQLPDGRLLVVSPHQIAVGDGARWEVFDRAATDATAPLEGVAVASDGRIYAGMRNGFGEVTFRVDGTWELQQVADWPEPLRDRIPIPRFCVAVQDDWFWHSESGVILRWRPGETVTEIGRASTVAALFRFQDELFMSDRVIGQLFRLPATKDRLPVFVDKRLTADDAITCTVPFGDKVLVGTYAKGLQLFDGQSVTPFTRSGILAHNTGFVDLRAIDDNRYIGAIDGFGIVYFDHTGALLNVFDRTRDPRVTRVRRLVPTGNGVLWALLGDGVARIELSSPLTTFESLLPAGADFVSVQRHDGDLWLLSNGKILRARYDLSDRLLDFELVPFDREFAFSLSTASGEILVGTEVGLYRHRDDNWILVDRDTLNFRLLTAQPQHGRWLYSAVGELGWMGHAADGSLTFDRTPVADFPGTFESCSAPDGVVWLEMGSGALGRVAPRPDGTLDFKQLGAAEGVPDGWVQVYAIDEHIAFNVGDRLFRYDEQTNRLEPHVDHDHRFSDFRYIVGRPSRDAAGRVWVSGDDRVHVFDTQTEPWTNLALDLPDGLRPYFFTPEKDGVMWLHGDRRLARFDPSQRREHVRPARALITRLVFPVSKRSVISVGDEIDDLDYNDNSFTAYFSAPDAGLQPPVTFEVRLRETDTWESQGSSGSATFSRLPAGSYQLQVRARSDSFTTPPDAVSFRINPPWYRSRMAYLGFGFGGLALIGLAVWSITLLERREKQRLESLVRQRTRELKMTNEQLEDQVEEIRILSQAINQSPVSVLIAQREGTILFANSHACELGGTSERELIGRSTEGLWRDDENKHATIAIDTCLKKGESWTGELTKLRSDGKSVRVRTTISPIRNADDSVRFHLILEEDITAWIAEQELHRRLEDQLFQARKLESIGTLAGGIAHDFNNILTGILGVCEMALLDLDPKSPLATDLNDIRKSGLRAKDLVSQILTFSRKADSKLVAIDLSKPVGEALKLFRASTPTSIEIVSHLHSGMVLADETQIHQVVINLCTNAAHALTGESGRIDVELKRLSVDLDRCAEIAGLRPGDYLVLIVTDNGTGMDAAILERIFDPFFTTKEQGKGTGLGLSIVQGIMANHRGAYRVQSRPGAGTSFELFFPTTTITATVPSERRLSIDDGASREVLIVDDEATVVQFVASRLTQFGYLPCVFSDPREALATIRLNPARFEAIVTDLTMPHLSGADLIHRIRELGSTIPAIVITGYGRENALERLHTLSNTYVLGKPFAGEELARLLGRAIRANHVAHG